jgi:hydrogenase maturation protein HypF
LTTKHRVAYHIEGIVQGVGFRPFVYTLALRYGLTGFVLNNALGVEIELEGSKERLETFNKSLLSELPPLARVDVCEKKELPFFGYANFTIHESEEGTLKSSLVLPDMALCPDCLEELGNPTNRRHHYFFINCTNCGPRYSIVKTVPYDRPHTSMHPFVMCDACQAEYTNPLDRRYHAQPISCSQCGPTVVLKQMDGVLLGHDEEALKLLAQKISEGFIVVMKGMGGFHLICDATNDKAVQTLRERKQRAMKPFAVMFKDMSAIEEVCSLSVHEKAGLLSQLRPIVLVKKKEGVASFISPLVAPNINRLGVFLPYTPLHVMLFNYLTHPIIATSANRSGEPILYDASSLEERLGGIVDVYLDYNREIVNSSDDSIVQYIDDQPLLLRLSRGLAPLSFRFKTDEKRSILAVGAHQKNAVAIYLNGQVIVSPYIGDLDTLAGFELFIKTLQRLEQFYDFKPELIVADLHPNYATTQWAKKQDVPFIQIQHHYAHILSAMFEHRLDEKVLGIAWDGTGYGKDGTIWGGEFLLCDTHGFERVAHFEPFHLLGGDASIKETRRVLASIMWDLESSGHEVGQSLEKYFTSNELKNLKQLYTKKINAPLCTSLGRIFDAVAVLCGMEGRVSYDGQSGLFIESLYDDTIQGAYSFTCKEGIVTYKEAFLEMLHDEPRVIASKFINALANLIVEMAKKYPYKVVLSGGVFQNRTLLEKVLTCKEIEFISQHQIPPNDGGICVGQLYFALNN